MTARLQRPIICVWSQATPSQKYAKKFKPPTLISSFQWPTYYLLRSHMRECLKLRPPSTICEAPLRCCTYTDQIPSNRSSDRPMPAGLASLPFSTNPEMARASDELCATQAPAWRKPSNVIISMSRSTLPWYEPCRGITPCLRAATLWFERTPRRWRGCSDLRTISMAADPTEVWLRDPALLR